MSDVPEVGAGGLKGNKKVLMLGGGAAVLYVVYSWHRSNVAKAQAAATAAAAPAAMDSGYVTQASAGVPGNYAPTTASQLGTSSSSSTAPLDNAAWTQQAVQLLQGAGYDPQTTTNALAKYLGKQPLSDAEQLVVRSALAMAGTPPVGSFIIVPALPTPTPAANSNPVIDKDVTIVSGHNEPVQAVIDEANRLGYPMTWGDFWVWNPGIPGLQMVNGNWTLTQWGTPVVVAKAGFIGRTNVAADVH